MLDLYSNHFHLHNYLVNCKWIMGSLHLFLFEYRNISWNIIFTCDVRIMPVLLIQVLSNDPYFRWFINYLQVLRDSYFNLITPSSCSLIFLFNLLWIFIYCIRDMCRIDAFISYFDPILTLLQIFSLISALSQLSLARLQETSQLFC